MHNIILYKIFMHSKYISTDTYTLIMPTLKYDVSTLDNLNTPHMNFYVTNISEVSIDYAWYIQTQNNISKNIKNIN